jgi:hypothetical protein
MNCTMYDIYVAFSRERTFWALSVVHFCLIGFDMEAVVNVVCATEFRVAKRKRTRGRTLRAPFISLSDLIFIAVKK